MNIYLKYTLFILAGFFSGSIPFGYIAGKIKGINIKEYGSGNIGTTNVFRTLGIGWGIVVFIFDFAKGFIPVFLSLKYLTYPEVVALGAVLGHIYSPFLKFRGGKGVATTIGVFLPLSPIPFLISLAAWPLTFIITRTASISSLSFILVLPFVILIMKGAGSLFYLSLAVFIVVVVAHRENIKRIIKGKEGRLR